MVPLLINDQRHNNSLSQVHKTFFVSALTTEQINAWSKKGKYRQTGKTREKKMLVIILP